jgi:hypothetical protein
MSLARGAKSTVWLSELVWLLNNALASAALSGNRDENTSRPGNQGVGGTTCVNACGWVRPQPQGYVLIETSWGRTKCHRSVIPPQEESLI